MKNLQGTLYIFQVNCLKSVNKNLLYHRIFVKSCTLLQYSEHLLSIYLSFSPCLNLFLYTCFMFHWIFLMYLVQPHQKVSSTPSAGTFLTLSFFMASCTSSHLFNGFKFKLRNEHFMWLSNGIVALVPPILPLSYALNGQSGNTSLKVGTSAPAWSNTIFMTPHKPRLRLSL